DFSESNAFFSVDDKAAGEDADDNNVTIQTFTNDDTVRDSSPIREATNNLHRLRFLVTDVTMKGSENKSLVQSDSRERNRFFRAPRIGSRRIRNRLVQKYGLCNISLVNVPKQRRKYFRYPTSECPLVIVTMCLQFMLGVMCQTLMAGVIFAKLARPIKRAATILFRVGDMRKSSLAEAHVRLQMIKKCITYEGELLPFHQFDMDVGYDDGLDRVFVIWPITICHEIDENSPLYDVSKETLETSRFEIIAILEGVVESVGSTTQARTSYLPNEILWGKRFEKLVTYQRENGEYRIDFGKFHNVYDVDTPTCSAKELDEMRAAGLNPEDAYQVVPRIGSESSGTSSKVSFHSHKTMNNRLSVADVKENDGIIQRVRIETDDEDEEYDNTITLDVGLKHKKSIIRSQSPDYSLRHKQSTRRGPDLF
ncbi:unnamed protein product, partial [Anisakis simplex]|uniref:IRK_C domain-containing protein n=1 Tax=Anisakis simplex TaxID=6269 RepID=A0A158PMS2_ANISI